MVVGDRLWLFTQNPSTHPQPMIMNNSTLPLRSMSGVQSLSPTVLTAMPSTTSSTHSDGARNNFIPSNQPVSYGISKPEPFFQRIPPHLKSYDGFGTNKFDQPPIEERRNYMDFPLATNQSKLSFNKYLSHDYQKMPDRTTANYFGKPKMPLADLIESNCSLLTSSAPFSIDRDTASAGSNGIAELERAFGSIEKYKISNKEVNSAKALHDDFGAVQASNDCFSENSDVDCEELDEKP